MKLLNKLKRADSFTFYLFLSSGIIILSGYLENVGGLLWSCNGLFGSFANPVYCQILHNIKGLSRKIIENWWIYIIGIIFGLYSKILKKRPK